MRHPHAPAKLTNSQKMHLKPLLVTVLTVAMSLLEGLNLRAQEPTLYELSPRTLSFALVFSFTVGGTFEVDPEDPTKFWSPKVPAFESTLESAQQLADGTPASISTVTASKVNRLRYGNAQLIAELVLDGVLTAPASGWALCVVGGNAENTLAVVAKKAGLDDVVLEGLGVSVSPVAMTQNFSDTTVNKLDSDGFVTFASSAKGTYSTEGSASISLQLLSLTAELQGTMSDRGTLFTWYPEPTDKSRVESLLTSRGMRIASLAGSGSSAFRETPDWITGTVSVGPDKVVKVLEPQP